MATSDVRVLGSFASPFSNRVQMALNLKSIHYEFIEENFYSNKSDRLLKANPIHNKIPVLIHDDKPICESLVIVEYIDDVWANTGPSILPSDPYDRAAARFWAAYIDEKWFPMFKELSKTVEAEAKVAIMGKVFEGVAFLEETFVKCSKGKTFFGGDEANYLDIALGCYLAWLGVIELSMGLKLFDQTKFPGLAGWAEAFGSHKAAKDVLPDVQKLIEFHTMVHGPRSA